MRRVIVTACVSLVFFSAAQAEETPPFAFEWVLGYTPGQMTTDSEGNLWVVNTQSLVVQRMTRDGHSLYPVPYPSVDVCRNPTGYMYVMDTRSYVVFDDSVSIVQAYFPPTGTGIIANANDHVFIARGGSLKVISVFDSDGYLLHNRPLSFAPHDLALSQNGVLLTLDSAGHRIVRFDSYLRYLEAWTGYDGTALTSDPDGNIYVLSSDHITKLSPDGTLLTTWGEPGQGPGQFSDAVGITLNDQGDVYVADRSSRRILMFGKRLPTDNPPPPPVPPPPPIFCGLASLTHHEPALLLHVTSPVTDCACRGPNSIASVVTTADPSPDGSVRQFVYVVMTPGSTGLLAFEAAIAYRPHRPDRPGLEIVSWHACADLELPQPDWPDSAAGNTFTWEECHFTDVAVGGYFEVIAHDAETLRTTPHRQMAQVKWAACPSRNLDDVIAANRLGWVSWGGDAVGLDHDGCNPALGPCQGLTPVHPTTWGRMKALFRNP